MGAVKGNASAESLLAAVLAHPIRFKAFILLNERVASPKEIGEAFGENTGTVSYHVKCLMEIGAVELVDEQKRRGAVEHFYRAAQLAFVSDEEWADLSESERRPYSIHVAQLGIADIAKAIDDGTFDRRHDRYLTRVRALVDEEGWGELHALHAELMERTLAIKAACADRIAKDPDAPTTSVMQFATFFEESGLPTSPDR